MKEWFGKHKSEILVGIVVFVITTLLSKVANLLFTSAPLAGKTLFNRLVNSVYHQAAHESPLGLLAWLFSTAFSAFVVYTVIEIVKGFRAVRDISDVEEAEKMVRKLEEMDKNDPEIEKEIDKARSFIGKIKSRYLQKRKNNPRRDKAILFAFILFISVYVLYIFAYEIVPAAMWTGFEQSVTQIAPYIEEHDEELLRSKWVSMDSQEDYYEISKYIKQIKAENDLS